MKVHSAFDLFDKYVSLDYPVTLDEYNQRVEAAWKKINDDFSNRDLSTYLKLPQKLTLWLNGYILAYGFVETYTTRWVNGELVRENVAMANEAIGYYWENGTMFTIKSPGSSLATGDITDIINHLSSYAWSKAPTKPGICLYQGFFEKYYAPSFEQVTLSIEFTDQFGFSLVTKRGEVGRGPGYRTMLQRIGPQLRATPDGVDKGDDKVFINHVYRADDYVSPHFDGEEIVRSISSNLEDDDSFPWTNKMLGRWEVIGGLYEDSRAYI